MADKKISALTASTTPLAGTEVLPIVQSGATVKVSVANLTAGRAVSASSLTASTDNVIIATTAKGVTTGSAIPLGLGVNNTVTAMTIDTASNIGVGTATPTGKFVVVSGSSTGNTVAAWTNYSVFGPNGGSATGAGIGFGYNTSTDQSEIVSVAPATAWKNLAFFSGGITFNATSGSESMRITSAGNVGIGTTAPGAKLDVYGGAAGTATSIQAGNASTGFVFGIDSADNCQIRTAQSVSILFYNAGSERMRIDSAGNVGIGTASPAATALLDVQSTTKGVRFPNMTTGQKAAITPSAGTVVFDTTLSKLCVYSGAAWETITSV